MKSISTLAIAVSLIAGGAVVASPAEAQRKDSGTQQSGKKEKVSTTAEAGGRKYQFSKEAVKAIQNLQKVVNAGDTAGYPAALAAAEAAAKNTDDRYVIGQLRLNHAIKTKDDAATAQAIDAMIRSGGATQAELPILYRNLGALHYNAKRYDDAAAAFIKLVEIDPNNPDNTLRLAELRNQQGRTAEGVTLIEQAIAARKAAGQQVPEEWYKRAVALAHGKRLAPQALKLSREWVTAYPTATNWRDTLRIYQDMSKLDEAAQLDLLRLMRAAKVLTIENDVAEYAYTAVERGLPGEAMAVLNEAFAARAVDRNKPHFRDLVSRASGRVQADRQSLPTSEKQAAAAATGKIAANTADAYLGYGDYAKAAALYRTALSKGQVDANVVNTRLGIALALSGDKAGATNAFKSVTGPRAELANYWMLWLAQRG
jgi:tetratricopeptide (TPR) repeat protein